MGSAGYIIVLLCVVVVGALFGWRRGLSHQCGSLLGVAFGIAGVRVLLPEFAPTVESWLDGYLSVPCPEYLVASVGSLIIYAGFYLLFLLCGIVLNKLAATIAVKPWDSILGLMFGVVKWLIAVSVVYNACLGVSQSGALCELSVAGDGNPVELVMDISPLLFSTPSPDEMHHRMQLIEARCISCDCSGGAERGARQNNVRDEDVLRIYRTKF